MNVIHFEAHVLCLILGLLIMHLAPCGRKIIEQERANSEWILKNPIYKNHDCVSHILAQAR